MRSVNICGMPKGEFERNTERKNKMECKKINRNKSYVLAS